MAHLKFSNAKKRGFNDFRKGVSVCPFKDELLQSFWAKGFRIAHYLEQRAKRKDRAKKVVRILCQYEENYGFSEGKQAWKYKGSHEFHVRVAFDSLMYEKEQVDAVIREFVQAEADDLHRFTLIEWEPIFHEPQYFDQARFDAALSAKLQAIHS